jgi:hypothetical protein
MGPLMGASLWRLFGQHNRERLGRLAATGAGVFLGGLRATASGPRSTAADAAYYASPQGLLFALWRLPSAGNQQTYVAPPEPMLPRVIYVEPEIVEYRRVETRLCRRRFMGPPPGERQRERERNAAKSAIASEFTQTIKIDGQTQRKLWHGVSASDGTGKYEP